MVAINREADERVADQPDYEDHAVQENDEPLVGPRVDVVVDRLDVILCADALFAGTVAAVAQYQLVRAVLLGLVAREIFLLGGGLDIVAVCFVARGCCQVQAQGHARYEQQS